MKNYPIIKLELIGPPGTGKSLVIDYIRDFLRKKGWEMDERKVGDKEHFRTFSPRRKKSD